MKVCTGNNDTPTTHNLSNHFHTVVRDEEYIPGSVGDGEIFSGSFGGLGLHLLLHYLMVPTSMHYANSRVHLVQWTRGLGAQGPGAA